MEHLGWPSYYLGQGLRLVPLLPRSKTPFRADRADPATGWHVRFVDTAEAWEAFHRQRRSCNLAIVWFGCQVDADSPEALRWAQNHGVDADRAVWQLQTGRGFRFLYRTADRSPPAFIDPTHQRPDLLGPGRLAVIPPSVHPSRRLYAWVQGHSPAHIPIQDLDPLPDPVLTAWRKLKATMPIHRVEREAPGWLGLVFDAICDHLEAAGHRLRRGGDGGVVTTCCFHEDHDPSLALHPERGWKCFAGCGEGRLTLLAAKLGIRL